MGFVTEIFDRIDARLVHFAAEKSQDVASMIEPAVVTGMSLYLLFYGYKHMLGQVEEPFMAFVDSSVKMAAIVGTALTAGIYNDYFITTFQDSPAALAAALSGASGGGTLSGSMGATLDQVFADCYTIGFMFWDWPGINIDGYIIGSLVMFLGTAITAYTGFLVVMSKVITALTLAVGPLFIASLLFEKTKNYFGQFINTLINYGLVGALSVGANALILSMFQETAADVSALGTTAKFADLGGMIVSGVIGILILMQVTSLASGLAGGVSLQSFGIGRTVARAGGKAMNKATGGQRRENQRAAENSHDIDKRKAKLIARAEPRKPRGGKVRKDGTNN